MALPTKGAWARTYGQSYSGGTAAVWGTGINDVHAYYGSPPDRLALLAAREGEIATRAPYDAVPEYLVAHDLWGYPPDDSRYTGIEYDARQPYDVPSEDRQARWATPKGFPPLNATGGYRDRWRRVRQGAYRWYADNFVNPPSETVTEGWRNKPKTYPSDAEPSSDNQLTRQTSMQQRYQVRANDLAVERGTDPPRASIDSRVVAMKEKRYSTGERLYDMLPKEQTATYARPFWYRQAGTAEPELMEVNEAGYRYAVERTPPPDPYIGTGDTDQAQLNYGYTDEDNFYA